MGNVEYGFAVHSVLLLNKHVGNDHVEPEIRQINVVVRMINVQDMFYGSKGS